MKPTSRPCAGFTEQELFDYAYNAWRESGMRFDINPWDKAAARLRALGQRPPRAKLSPARRAAPPAPQPKHAARTLRSKSIRS